VAACILIGVYNHYSEVYTKAVCTSVGSTNVKMLHVLSGYITTLKNKQKLDVSSEGPSSRVSSRDRGKKHGLLY
jgi:hypothetical protein